MGNSSRNCIRISFQSVASGCGGDCILSEGLVFCKEICTPNPVSGSHVRGPRRPTQILQRRRLHYQGGLAQLQVTTRLMRDRSFPLGAQPIIVVHIVTNTTAQGEQITVESRLKWQLPMRRAPILAHLSLGTYRVLWKWTPIWGVLAVRSCKHICSSGDRPSRICDYGNPHANYLPYCALLRPHR